MSSILLNPLWFLGSSSAIPTGRFYRGLRDAFRPWVHSQDPQRSRLLNGYSPKNLAARLAQKSSKSQISEKVFYFGTRLSRIKKVSVPFLYFALCLSFSPALSDYLSFCVRLSGAANISRLPRTLPRFLIHFPLYEREKRARSPGGQRNSFLRALRDAWGEQHPHTYT